MLAPLFILKLKKVDYFEEGDKMKKIFYSKVFIGFICFILGFAMNHYLTKIHFHSEIISESDSRNQFPVNPDDIDHDKMLDAMSRLQRDMMKESGAGFEIAGIDKREDDANVYYDIPLNANELNRKLNVNVKDGMISLSETTGHSESERQFTIDPGLDETKADVQVLKDKVSIKIPKKK
jgi:hypothetical protein